MCGSYYCGGYSGTKKIDSPIWRVSDDKRHIVFYGDNSECIKSTSWCKKHCYLKTKPADALKDIKPKYLLSYFIDMEESPFRKDFEKAKYVTLFGSGTIEFQFDREIMESGDYFPKETLELPRLVIKNIPMAHPQKIFRFFLRNKIEQDKIEKGWYVPFIPENSKLILSVDRDSDPDLVEWGLKENYISYLAVVNHKDNKFIIEYLSQKLNVIDCKTCRVNGYLCFKKNPKSLLLLQYIEKENGEDDE